MASVDKKLSSVAALSPDEFDTVGDLARALKALQANTIEVLEQKRQLEQLNTRFQIALNNMARGISMFDADQRMIVCNNNYREIYDLPEVLTRPGTPLADIIRFHVKNETGRDDPATIAGERRWIGRHVAAITRGRTFSYTQSMRDGRIIAVTNQPLPDGGWVDIQEDVTEKHNYALMLEQRVAEKTREIAAQADELRRSNVELERFAYIASHDLKAPLRMVASYTQLLAKRYQGKLDDDANEFIRFAVDGVTRMQALIDDLIIYSRVGTRQSEFEETDCEHVVDCALSNLKVAQTDCGAAITRNALPVVRADSSQLLQVFQNLIGNALKFRCPERDPRVHIGAKRSRNGWTFTVRDNGIGIDPSCAEQLFVIFKRLHAQSEYPGTGIGLAICKKIVDRHGGRIWIETRKGPGATFRFSLPDRNNSKAHEVCHGPQGKPCEG